MSASKVARDNGPPPPWPVVMCLRSIVSIVDIGGHEDTVNAIFEAVILPLRRPELFNVVGSGNPRRLLGAPKGILLYGPPGRSTV